MAIFLRKLKSKPKKLLVCRTDRIGDFVLTLPVFQALREQTSIIPSVLCQDGVKPLLNGNPYIDEIISTSANTSIPQIARRIDDLNFDALLVMVNDAFTLELLPYLKKIPIRIGPLSKPSAFFQYTHPVIQKRSRSVKNEAEYNLELLEIFDISPKKNRPKIYQFESDYQELKTILNPLKLTRRTVGQSIIFHAGMAGSALNWKIENYEKLLEGLLENGFRVILTGYSDGEETMNHDFQVKFGDRFPEQIFDLTQKVSIKELTTLISEALLFIGPSTGPTHLANAVGTPVVSFYPPIQVQSKIRWQPFLANSFIFSPQVNCGQKYSCIGERCPHYYCMDKIQTKEVLERTLKLCPKP